MIDNILDLYDQEVAKHPGGIKTADAKAAIFDSVRELVEASDRDVDRETQSALDRAVNHERDRRSKTIAKDLEYILDYFVNPDEAALIPDSRMAWAIRLGTVDGADKTLRYWRSDDFIFWAQVRTRQADEARAAAQIAEDIAARVVTRMQAARVSHFGEVNWGRSVAA